MHFIERYERFRSHDRWITRSANSVRGVVAFHHYGGRTGQSKNVLLIRFKFALTTAPFHQCVSPTHTTNRLLCGRCLHESQNGKFIVVPALGIEYSCWYGRVRFLGVRWYSNTPMMRLIAIEPIDTKTLSLPSIQASGGLQTSSSKSFLQSQRIANPKHQTSRRSYGYSI